MQQPDLFLSYATADLAAAERLKKWLEEAPRQRTIWRDREGILPGAPEYYAAILEGISDSVAFAVLLSPRWLRSKVAPREFADALAAGKKILIVVHPEIPRDPSTPGGRERKAELMEALNASGLLAELEPRHWIWPASSESAGPNYAPVEQAVATDYGWASRHRLIRQRLDSWRAVQNDVAALLRGSELVELMTDAFADVPGRLPLLEAEERDYLLESQRHEAAERERVEGLYWGAQARSAALRGEAEPDLALLLASEGAAVAPVPEARRVLLTLLDRHAALTGVLHGHGPGRSVSGVAFSRDGRFLASVDRAAALGDVRRAHLLVRDAATGAELKRVGVDAPLGAVAWGDRWLAVASPGTIGWLRWDDGKERFRGNSPTALEGGAAPDYVAFSPSGAIPSIGDVLAWGTQRGEVGLIRTSDHVRQQGRLSDDHSGDALSGLGWLRDGRLITAEGGCILARPFPHLEPAEEVAAPGTVFSLVSDGDRWVAACRRDGVVGLLVGAGSEVVDFLPIATADLALTAALAGQPGEPWIVTGSRVRRSGAPAVALWKSGATGQILLQGEDDVVSGVAADFAGRFVAAGDVGGRVWLWDRSRRSHLVREALPGVSVRSLTASRSGRVALATQDGRVLTLGPGVGGRPDSETTLPFVLDRLLFADRGRVLLAAAAGGEFAAVDCDGGARIVGWPRVVGTPRDIAVAADASIAAALCTDRAIIVCRLEPEVTAVRVIEAGSAVRGLALDPGGQRVYVAAEDGLRTVIQAWRVDAPEEAPVELYAFDNPPLWTAPIAFAGDDLFALGDGDDLVFVAPDASGGATRRSGHDNPVKCIRASADLFASVACWFQDTNVDQVRLWTREGQPLGPVTLPEHAADLALPAASGSVLVLGHSGTLWRVALCAQSLTEAARRVAGRSLTREEERRYGVDAWRARRSMSAN